MKHPSPRLMPAPIAAAYIGVSESKLRQLPIRRKVLDGKRLYERADLDDFADRLDYEGCKDDVADRAFGLRA